MLTEWFCWMLVEKSSSNQSVLPFIRAEVMTEPQTGIQLNMEAWTEGRMLLTEEQMTNLRLQVDAFLEYIG